MVSKRQSFKEFLEEARSGIHFPVSDIEVIMRWADLYGHNQYLVGKESVLDTISK